jgi:uncharacterized protein (TIGR02145 family)
MIDSRDGTEYQVAKLADGKCWMLDNLKLELTDGMTLTPTDSDVEQETKVWFTKDGTAAGESLPGMVDSGTNLPTSFTLDGFLTRDGTGDNPETVNQFAWRQVDPGSVTYCLQDNNGDFAGTLLSSKTGCGYLYNFYTITAGSTVKFAEIDESDGSITEPARFVPGDGSICPANWRLPSGYINTADISNDFPLLNARMTNANARNGSIDGAGFTKWQVDGPFHGVLSGRWGDAGSNTAGFAGQNSDGYFWSSSVSGDGNVYGLHFNTSAVEPGNKQLDAIDGLAARCVVNQ